MGAGAGSASRTVKEVRLSEKKFIKSSLSLQRRGVSSPTYCGLQLRVGTAGTEMRVHAKAQRREKLKKRKKHFTSFCLSFLCALA